MKTNYDLVSFIKEIKKEFKISRFGEVRSKKTGAIIRPYVHKSRNIFYLRIALKGKQVLVHKLNFLVHSEEENLPALVYKIEELKHQIDHDDGNSFNNHWPNLFLRPPEENQAKRRPYYKGEL